jgi:U3 small nucleolar RNA-associated protein 13
LRGHRRGVWCVAFSPVDQVLASASGDKTVRIWSLADQTCLKTFEGHSNSVLKVVFITRGLQLASCGSDGLVKVWTVRANECAATLDGHEDRVWALAASADGQRLASGSADAVLHVWDDTTQETTEKAQVENEMLLLQQQDLANLIEQKRYREAALLALRLDQPLRLLGILADLQGDASEMTAWLAAVSSDAALIDRLLGFVRDWNTNTRTFRSAQLVLHALLQQVRLETLLKLVPRPRLLELVDTLLPYTERHYKRAAGLVEQAYLVDYSQRRASSASSAALATS